MSFGGAACASFSTGSGSPLVWGGPLQHGQQQLRAHSLGWHDRQAQQQRQQQQWRRFGSDQAPAPPAAEPAASDRPAQPDVHQRAQQLWQERRRNAQEQKYKLKAQREAEQRRQQGQQGQQQQGAAGAARPGPVGVCNRKSVAMGWKKLDFVKPLVRRRPVSDALAQLAACPKRAALEVLHAVANARNNAVAQGADPARLVVERVWTGRAPPFKKPWFHGRGYHSVRQRRRTHLTVVVAEAPEGEAVGGARAAKLVRPAMLRPRRERRYPRPGQLPAAAPAGA